METYNSVPESIDGLFWLQSENDPACQPVFVHPSKPGVVMLLSGDCRPLNTGERLFGPQSAPITDTIPARAASTIKLDGAFVVDMSVKKGNCLLKGLNEALDLARIPVTVVAFPKSSR